MNVSIATCDKEGELNLFTGTGKNASDAIRDAAVTGGYCGLCQNHLSVCCCGKDTKELIALDTMRTRGLISESDYKKKAKKIHKRLRLKSGR